MSEARLHFMQIGIVRLEGLEPSGFALNDLASGINIVYGPNASGKTSLSGAIRQLLSPREPADRYRRSVLKALLKLDSEAVLVEFDMGDVRSHAGPAQAMPPLVPEGLRDRYIFALDDLLKSDASDLAGELIRQSAGGFDLRGPARTRFSQPGFDAGHGRLSKSPRRARRKSRRSARRAAARRPGAAAGRAGGRMQPRASRDRPRPATRKGNNLGCSTAGLGRPCRGTGPISRRVREALR